MSSGALEVRGGVWKEDAAWPSGADAGDAPPPSTKTVVVKSWSIMARARARYGVEGKPTERMGWRAMRKTRSANAVNLCEDLRIGRQHALARTGTEDNSGSCVVTWQWPLAACVVT